MKKLIFLALVLILAVQSRSLANITGSPHDFSGAGIRDTHGIGEICKICHTPHNSGSNLVPLWRGKLSGTYTFTSYSSDSLNATVNQPLAPTKACLTCHDGAIAKAAVTGCSSCHFSSSRHPEYPVRDLDLSNDHPVSFTFDTALAQADGTLHDPNSMTVSSLGGKTIKDGMLFQNRLECPSCHDVHATKGDSGAAGNKLLLVTNTNNALCLTCHNK